MKQCNRCGLTKSSEDFHKRSRSKDGLQGHCKACARKAHKRRYADPARRDRMLRQNRRWHQDNKDASAERHTRYRREAGVPPAHRVDPSATHHDCPRCGETVPVPEWSGSYCKPCNRERRVEWYQNNRERALQSSRESKARNPEGVRRWQRAATAAYRARKLDAAIDGVPVTADAIASRWDMWGDKCYLCAAPATETDHVIPLSAGGAHVPANLRPICRSCNATKSACDWRAFATHKEAT